MPNRSTTRSGRSEKLTVQVSVRLSQFELDALDERLRELAELFPEHLKGFGLHAARATAIRAALRVWLQASLDRPGSAPVLIKLT